MTLKKGKEIGDEIHDQGKTIDHLNDKLDSVENKAKKTKNKMENYLNQTSNCMLYVILVIELFVFVMLMSI
jgi:uncharacterized coiled-coil DUF342 family protein